MKHILITGAAGFIGINLVKKLLKENETNEIKNKIIMIDNFICSNKYFENIYKTMKDENENYLEFMNLDICIEKPELFINLFKNKYEIIDEIYHLASIASPIIYKKYPLETLDTSYIGSKNIFELGLYYKSKILITSTSEVYGDPLISPQNEDYFGNVNCYGPRSCYDEGKRVMETLAYVYQKYYNLDIKIIRIFNTYGPYMNIQDGRIIPSLIESYLCNKPIKIFNGGRQTRSYNYIDDTLEGMFKLMKSDIKTPVNIGNDKEISIIETYEIMKKIIKERYSEYYKELEIEYSISDENDPKIRRPDLQKSKELLDYEPKTTLEEGLCKTIDYFIEYHKW